MWSWASWLPCATWAPACLLFTHINICTQAVPDLVLVTGIPWFGVCQKIQISHYLCKTIRKTRYFSKMRPKAKYKVFLLLVIPHHKPISAFLDWELTLKVSCCSLNSLDHFWSQKSILWSTWPHINHSILNRICKLNLNIKKKSQKRRQFIM